MDVHCLDCSTAGALAEVVSRCNQNGLRLVGKYEKVDLIRVVASLNVRSKCSLTRLDPQWPDRDERFFCIALSERYVQRLRCGATP